MILNGGQFRISAKAGAPDTWSIVWRRADGSEAGPVEARLEKGDNAENLWSECEQADAEDLEDLGEKLWAFLMTGAAGAAWQAARDTPRAKEEVWRTGLWFEDDRLAALPWEVLKEPGELRHAFLVPDTTFCLLHEKAPSPQLAGDWPLRVLILKGAAQDAAIHTDSEAGAIHRAWQDQKEVWLDRRHGVVIKEVLPAGPTELEALLEKFRPHILHFAGHAEPEQLNFQPPGQTVWPWTAADIRQRFDGAVPLPRLVWLNACQTAIKKEDVQGRENAHYGLQRLFAGLGVPAVIGAKGNLHGGMAVQLAQSFYEGLRQGLPVDAALVEARKTARTWRKDPARAAAIKAHQPFLVSLMLSPNAAQAVQLPPAEPGYEDIVRDTPPLREVSRQFVDRHDVRFGLFGDLLDCGGRIHGKPRSRTLVLHGDELSGKTWLLRSLLAALAASGWLVRAHRIGDGPSRTWRELLAAVRNGAPQKAAGEEHSELLAALPNDHAAFADCDRLLAQPDQDPELVLEAFLTGLGKLGRPVVIALDQIKTKAEDTIRPDWLVQWEKHFFTKLGRGRELPVIGIAVMDSSSVAGSLLNETWRRPVGPIPKEELPRALRLYYCCHLQGRETDEDIVPLMEAALNTRSKSAPASGLTPVELAKSYQTWAQFVEANLNLKLPSL